jgi:hypothetical protein
MHTAARAFGSDDGAPLVLLDVVEVVPADDDGAVHLGGLDSAS